MEMENLGQHLTRCDSMESKLYPQKQFDEDIQKIRTMNISDEMRIEKGEALAYIFLNQENNHIIDPFAIGDMRIEILKES